MEQEELIRWGRLIAKIPNPDERERWYMILKSVLGKPTADMIRVYEGFVRMEFDKKNARRLPL